jgi:hypothetical protein
MSTDDNLNNAPDVKALQDQVHQLTDRATKAEQEQARLRGELDALQPFVRYGAEEPPQPHGAPGAPDTGEDEDPVVKLQNQVQTLTSDIKGVRGDLIARTFFIENPDLKDCEALVTTMLQQTPGRTIEERLTKAAEKTRQWLKDRDTRVLAAAEEVKKKKAKSEAGLEGVMDGSVTPPVKPEAEEKADLEAYSGIRRKEHDQVYGGGT